jgi:hypothetical protein
MIGMSVYTQSQGMGGVGKTMLTAAVIREEQVRRAFSIICVRSVLLYAKPS